MVSPYMMNLFKKAAANGIFCQYTEKQMRNPRPENELGTPENRALHLLRDVVEPPVMSPLILGLRDRSITEK